MEPPSQGNFVYFPLKEGSFLHSTATLSDTKPYVAGQGWSIPVTENLAKSRESRSMLLSHCQCGPSVSGIPKDQWMICSLFESRSDHPKRPVAAHERPTLTSARHARTD